MCAPVDTVKMKQSMHAWKLLSKRIKWNTVHLPVILNSYLRNVDYHQRAMRVIWQKHQKIPRYRSHYIVNINVRNINSVVGRKQFSRYACPHKTSVMLYHRARHATVCANNICLYITLMIYFFLGWRISKTWFVWYAITSRVFYSEHHFRASSCLLLKMTCEIKLNKPVLLHNTHINTHTSSCAYAGVCAFVWV